MGKFLALNIYFILGVCPLVSAILWLKLDLFLDYWGKMVKKGVISGNMKEATGQQ